jgi:hypothetical protein
MILNVFTRESEQEKHVRVHLVDFIEHNRVELPFCRAVVELFDKLVAIRHKKNFGVLGIALLKAVGESDGTTKFYIYFLGNSSGTGLCRHPSWLGYDD